MCSLQVATDLGSGLWRMGVSLGTWARFQRGRWLGAPRGRVHRKALFDSCTCERWGVVYCLEVGVMVAAPPQLLP